MRKHGSEDTNQATKRFGRLFPDLTAVVFKKKILEDLAATMTTKENIRGDSDIPAGYTYFGQFVDHDITSDSKGGVIAEPSPSPNLPHQQATPSLDLDSVYGANNEYLNQYGYFTLNQTIGSSTTPSQPDLERQLSGRARIADSRNEDNLALMHIHILFQQLHNKIHDKLQPGTIEKLAPKAKKETVAYYQHIVLYDYLKRILHPDVYSDVIEKDHCVLFHKEPSEIPPMPLEFSGAAYRFGHSMVRDCYNWNVRNPQVPNMDLLKKTGIGGDLAAETMHDNNWYIDWSLFLPDETIESYNRAKRIGTKLPEAFGELPHSGMGNLAYRNMARGVDYGLPSGQDVYKAIAASIPIKSRLTPDVIMKSGSKAQKEIYASGNLHERTPLWLYILLEAQIFHEGQHLGAVASQIVAEVILNLVRCSENSILVNEFDPKMGALASAIGDEKLELRHLTKFVLAD